MSGTIIRLIWRRELTDLLRDRRWLFMLLGLPVLIYPLFGLLGFVFALAMLDQVTVVGVVGLEHLPAARDQAWTEPSLELHWLQALPVPGMTPADAAGLAGAYLAKQHKLEPPPLVQSSGGRWSFLPSYLSMNPELGQIVIEPLLALDSGDLEQKRVSAVVVIPPDFQQRFAEGGNPTIEIHAREADELSKLAVRRLNSIFRQYRSVLKQTRLLRAGFPANFEQVFTIQDPDQRKPQLQRTTDELKDALIRFFPFMLVMWTLAGALYPAIDLCAGEKERGTMETLLISPADRLEIVAGKFLAVFTLSTVTAWWNLLWMGGGAILGSWFLGLKLVDGAGIFWCAGMSLPLAALFSALCIALGVYARSTKEGQYYLLPIVLGATPLVMLSFAPGLELTWKSSMIPITGVCLLLQRMLTSGRDLGQYVFLVPVLLALAVYIALALFWAVRQFHREDVLFREVERPGWRSWLRKLFPQTRDSQSPDRS